MEVIDLRSDTLSLPTPEMIESIRFAELGDDGRKKNGKGEDPTVIELEKLAAEIFNKEDALFIPSGTMGNILSLITHANRGSNIVVGKNSHIKKSEKGLFDPDIYGFNPVTVDQEKGVYNLIELEDVLKAEKVSLVCVENSYNFEGGLAIGKKDLDDIAAVCKKYNVPVHLDGARIFNAAIYLGEELGILTENMDTIMICLSKGLSAPIGSLLLGSFDFIKKAREKRKLIGGQLRQVGLIAAPGIVALKNMVDRLEEDNLRARKLADGISNIKALHVDLDSVQTNIVKAKIIAEGLNSDQLIEDLFKKYRLKLHKVSEDEVRLVTYRAIKDSDISEAIFRIQSYFKNKERQG